VVEAEALKINHLQMPVAAIRDNNVMFEMFSELKPDFALHHLLNDRLLKDQPFIHHSG
jgi:hypothetical protein